MDLSSYAELAVRLVNTASLGHEGGDLLSSVDELRSLVADREHLNHGISRSDLDALRMVRDEFRGFFVACSQGNGEDAAARLNELLIQFPVHPQLSGMTASPGTCTTRRAARCQTSTPREQPWASRFAWPNSALNGSVFARRRHASGSLWTYRRTGRGGTARTDAPAGQT